MRELLLLVPVLVIGCDQNVAKDILAGEGYTDITTRSLSDCGQGDEVRVGFDAIAPTGEQASGSVCCVGWLGLDCVIRRSR